MKALWLVALALAVIGGLWVSAPPASGDDPSCQSDSPPTIEGIEPSSSPPWSTVRLFGCNLSSNWEDCVITFGGVRGFVHDSRCAGAMWVNVPIAATSGPVVAVINGVPSEPFPYTVLPLDVGPEDIIPGAIYVGIKPGADINGVVKQMGDPAESITMFLRNPCSSSWPVCWYGITVPVGSEIEKSIQYYTHPDVLWASPNPVPIPAIGEPGLPLPAPPDALPPTGGEPAATSASSRLPLMAVGLGLVAVGVGLAAGRGKILR